MTDQKRDESTKGYQPIQQDPARRIRRIQRILSYSPERAPRFWSLFPTSQNNRRLERCDELFAAELSWLCDFTIAARNAWDRDIGYAEQTIAEQKARIEELERQLAENEERAQDIAWEKGDRE